MPKRISLVLITAIFAVALSAMYFYGRPLWVPIYQKIVGKRTVSEVVATYSYGARERMRPYFESAGVPYPPNKITFLGIKNAALLEVWAETESGPKFIRTYPIKALSGTSGPKLREGDRQVPEGLYLIEGLNPNSSYHLSMKLNYPNAFDLKHAAADGRHKPGTNIFIHGKSLSIGCLAMGDFVIEELFILATDIGRTNIQVAIAPYDPRSNLLASADDSQWISVLYQQLNTYFSTYIRSES